MGQILHGCAKTTETIRRAIQNSKESIAKLSRYYNLNPKLSLNGENGLLPKTLIWVRSMQDQLF